MACVSTMTTLSILMMPTLSATPRLQRSSRASCTNSFSATPPVTDPPRCASASTASLRTHSLFPLDRFFTPGPASAAENQRDTRDACRPPTPYTDSSPRTSALCSTSPDSTPFLASPSEPCGMPPRELVVPESVPVLYDFTIARRGQRAANVWLGDQVALVIEKRPDDSQRISAPPTVRTAVLRALDAVYLAYVYVTGFRPSGAENPFRGRVAIQVPLDNAGAAGLAHHDVAGISVGAGLVEPLVERWSRALANGASWVPRGGEGGDLESLRFGDERPELASCDQVFLYELNRNFWPPWFNKKIDWMCDGDESCWGWWTVGMNNAMTVIVPTLLNMPLNYFGSGLEQFRDRMVCELGAYALFCRSAADPFDAWTKSRMPWKPRESVNDLMTALIIRSFERFGGESWIKGFYRQIPNVPDVNETAAGGTNFQGARDNLYRIFSIAAGANLYNVFVNELCWHISDGAGIEIATLFPASNSLSLGLEDLSH